MIIIAFLWVLCFNQETPLKSKEDFDIKLNLSFKQRFISDDDHTLHFSETESERQRRAGTNQLAYINLILKVTKLNPDEIRIRVTKDNKDIVLNKKLSAPAEFTIDVGFAVDAKDQISGYKHVIEFLSKKKVVLSKILIEFDKEGNYFVNGEKRGKI